MHFDSNTGYAYYLHEATNNSVWANNDGSFPADGVPDVTGSSEGHHDLYNANGEGAGGFQQWDFGVFGGGDRPPPTAPPLFSASLELAQGQNGGEEGLKADIRVLYCCWCVFVYCLVLFCVCLVFCLCCFLESPHRETQTRPYRTHNSEHIMNVLIAPSQLHPRFETVNHLKTVWGHLCSK